MNDKQIIIDLLMEKILCLKQENACLKGYKKTKTKRMKPKHRKIARHLKLIAVNGVPISGKGGAE